MTKDLYILIVEYYSSLSHPNIIQLYGILEEPKAMVLEYVGGGDLFELIHPEEAFPGKRDALQQSDIPWEQRIAFAHDIAAGLAYLQSISPPIIHRDLRSPNIFVSISEINIF